MKFAYASLAFGMVAADVFDQAADIFNQVFVETDNGFDINLQPYFAAQIEIPGLYDNAQANNRFEINLDGTGEPLIIASETTIHEDGLTIASYGSGVYIDLEPELLYLYNLHPLAIDYADNFKFNSFQFVERVEVSGSIEGLNLGITGQWNNDNNAATQKWSAGLSINPALDGDDVSVEISTNLNVSNQGAWSKQFINENTYDFEADATISTNLDQCISYFGLLVDGGSMAGAKCKVSTNVNYECADLGEGEIEANLNFKPAKVAVDVTLPENDEGVVEVYTYLIRGEDKDENVELLSNGNYYGVYYHEGLDTRKAFRNDQTTLVIRFPGLVAIEEVIFPAAEKLAEPLINFYNAIEENAIDLPLLAVWFDRLADNMTNEFDYSSLVDVARIDSEEWAGLNADAKQFLVDLNDDIIAALQSDIVTGAAQIVRNYVSYLVGDDGLADFQAVWAVNFGYQPEE